MVSVTGMSSIPANALTAAVSIFAGSRHCPVRVMIALRPD